MMNKIKTQHYAFALIIIFQSLSLLVQAMPNQCTNLYSPITWQNQLSEVYNIKASSFELGLGLSSLHKLTDRSIQDLEKELTTLNHSEPYKSMQLVNLAILTNGKLSLTFLENQVLRISKNSSREDAIDAVALAYLTENSQINTSKINSWINTNKKFQNKNSLGSIAMRELNRASILISGKKTPQQLYLEASELSQLKSMDLQLRVVMLKTLSGKSSEVIISEMRTQNLKLTEMLNLFDLAIKIKGTLSFNEIQERRRQIPAHAMDFADEIILLSSKGNKSIDQITTEIFALRKSVVINGQVFYQWPGNSTIKEFLNQP